jgi:hypothetical protein
VWNWFLAYFRLSKKAVCEQSVGKGPYEDYHDYPDSTRNSPDHFVTHECKRCGKEFFI